jgi:hypothetical protein
MIESPKKLPAQDQQVAVEGRLTRVWWEYLFHLDDRVRKLIRGLSTNDDGLAAVDSRIDTALGTGALTVGTLPSAVTSGAGARRFVTDANATTFLSVAAGGGANAVPVVSDGTNWLIG